MKLSIVRALALVAPLAVVVGCSGAAPSDGEAADSTSSAMLVPGPIFFDPIALCGAIPADQTMTYGATLPASAPPGIGVFAGTSNPNRACDYSVFEVTGALNQTMRLQLSDLIPDLPSTSPTPLGYPYTSITEATCASSYVEFGAFGWVPPKFILNGQTVTEIPGKWEAIGPWQTINGTWGYGSGKAGLHCTFHNVENPGLGYAQPLGVTGIQSYGTVRVAVKAVASTPAGDVRGLLLAFKTPH